MRALLDLRCSLKAAVIARNVSRVLASVSEECSMIDSEGLGGRPSAWPISIISGVANRQGNAVTARPAESAAVTADVPPPLAERLLLHRGPKFVIPLGLLIISVGFMLLVLVISSEYASWVTLLPSCPLAGIGLGSPIRPSPTRQQQHCHRNAAGWPRAWI